MSLPRPQGFIPKRELWVPEEINEVLAGEARALGFPDPSPSAGVRQLYIAGYLVSGTLFGDPASKAPHFERLLRVNEVWVMCMRAPRDNQWRLMGRFTAQNVFVGLRLFSRAFLNGDAHYHQQAQDFEQNWPATETFIAGTKIEDYISQPVSDPYVPRI
jgi:hypothetical protein